MLFKGYSKVMHMAEQKDQIKHLVRVMNTDLIGSQNINVALTKIKGVGRTFANAICVVADMPRNLKAGKLVETQIQQINSIVTNPLKFNIPSWMLNRRKDYETGADLHITKSDLDFTQGNDIKRLKMIKCYRGFRHHLGLPCRGQRTKSNFRRNKGKTSLGVKRKSK